MVSIRVAIIKKYANANKFNRFGFLKLTAKKINTGKYVNGKMMGEKFIALNPDCKKSV